MTSENKPAEPAGRSRGNGGGSRAHVGVASLERGLALLCVLEGREGHSLSESARRAGLNKTTAFRLMRSLERGGFVARGEDDRYRLGKRLIDLAGSAKGARAATRDA